MEHVIYSKGKQYELGLFLLSLYNALKYPKLKFQLGREVNLADKFDDLVIKQKEFNEEKYICCQVKHLDDCNAVISSDVLLGSKQISLSENDFTLKKYFLSYLRIIDQFRGTNKVLEKLIIFTNARLNESISFSRICTSFNSSKLLEVEENSENFYLKFEADSDISVDLLKVITDFDALIELLQKYTNKNKNENLNKNRNDNKTMSENKNENTEDIMTLNNSFLKYYHTALIDEKILLIKSTNRGRGRECQFHDDFKNDNNLSDIAKKFRKCMLEKSKNKKITDATWKTGKIFGLKDLDKTIEEKIAQNLVQYLKHQNDQNTFEFKALNENYISYYYLELIDRKIFVENNSVLKFHQDFVSNKTDNYYKHILDIVRCELNVDKDNETDFKEGLKKISFIVNLNLKHENNFLNPIIKLPSDNVITINTIKDFLHILEFKVNQPNVENLFKFFQNKLKTDDAIKYSLQLTNFITNWIKENGQTETWISNQDIKKLLNDIQKQISLNKVNFLTENLIEFIDEKINSFNIKYLETINGLDSFMENETKYILCIKTEQILLTSMKLRQYIKSKSGKFTNHHVFFNYHKAVKNKKRKEILEACSTAIVKFIFVYAENLNDVNIYLLEDLIDIVRDNNKKLIVVKSGVKESLPIEENDEIEYVVDKNIDVHFIEDITRVKEVQVDFLNKQVKLSNLFPKKEDLFKFLDFNILSKIIKGESISIGSNLRTRKDIYLQSYIKRQFSEKNSVYKFRVWDLLETNQEKKIVVICGAAGLGKTSVLYEIEDYLKKAKPIDWVTQINLNECTNQFKSILDNNEEIDETFLCKLLFLSETQIEYKLIMSALLGNGNIFVLFDALDEICPDYTELVIRFIKILQKSYVRKIVITTRPNVLEHFENGLDNTIIYKLEYLSKNEQFEFLNNEFRKKLNESYLNAPERLRLYVEHVLYVHSGDPSDINKHTFTSIPLNLKILSEIYAKNGSNDFESCEDFLKGNNGIPNLLDAINFSNIYEKCIESKLKRHLSEKQKTDLTIPSTKIDFEDKFNKIIEIHKEISMQTMLNTNDLEQLDLPKVFDRVNVEEHNFGLVDYFHEGKPIFMHKTYAEYFAALYIKDYLVKPEKSPKVFDFVLNQILVVQEFQGVRLFLNTSLQNVENDVKVFLPECSKESFKIAVTEDNTNIVKYLLNHNISLDEKFVKEMFLKAAKNKSVEIVKQFISYQEDQIISNTIKMENKLNINYDSNILKHSTALHYAAITSNTQLTEILLEKNSLVNFQNDYGLTALHIAAIFQNESVLNILLHHGADRNCQDKILNTPIHWAIINKNKNITETFLKSDIQPNLINEQNDSYLSLSARNKWTHVVKELLSQQANPNIQDRFGFTPLYIATFNNSIDVVNELLSHQADPNIQNYGGFTPLYDAAQTNSIGIAKELLSHQANPNVQNKEGFTPLRATAFTNSIDVAKELLAHQADPNIQDTDGNTPLCVAAQQNSIDVAKELLCHQADPNIQNKNGWTPLYIATLNNTIDVAKELLSYQADPNIQNKDGTTPLYMAAQENLINIAIELLSHYADPNIQNKKGFTPLRVAAVKNSIDVVKELLAYQANPNIQDNNKCTPLHVAAQQNSIDVAKELLSHHADPNIQSKDGLIPLHLAALNKSFDVVKELLHHQSDLNIPDSDGSTPLFIAAQQNSFDIARELLSHHADPDLQDKEGTTPLYIASQQNNIDFAKELLSYHANPNIQDKNGFAPLHSTAFNNSLDVAKELLYHQVDPNIQDKKGCTPLYIAAQQNSFDVARELLSHHADPNAQNKEGTTPLYIAVQQNSVDVAKELLSHQADPNIQDENGFVPLHVAAVNNFIDVTKELLSHEANPNIQNHDGYTPLYAAAEKNSIAVAKELLNYQANPNIQSKDGFAPLRIAACNNSIEVAKELLSHQADPNIQDKDGFTPLYVAAFNNCVDIIKDLLSYRANPNIQDKNGFTPLYITAEKNFIEAAKELLTHQADPNIQNSDGFAPLRIAAFNNSIDVAKELLSHQADPNIPDKDGFTPLYAAAQQNSTEVAKEILSHQANPNISNKDGFTPLQIAAVYNSLDVAKELLAHKANVNVQDKYGTTPLHLAVTNNSIDVAKELLSHQADPNIQDQDGFSPLHVTATNNSINVAKELLSHKANANIQDKNGFTPLYTAIQKNSIDVAKELLGHQADPNIEDRDGCTPLHVAALNNSIHVTKILLSYQANPNIGDNKKSTPLHAAAQKKSIDVAKELLSHHADPNIQNKSGYTPLHIASLVNSIDIAKELLSHQANPNIQGKDGSTPLYIAVQQNSFDIVTELLFHQANPNIQNKFGFTPLHTVATHNSIEIATILLSHQANPNIEDKDNYTPLHASSLFNTLEITKELLINNAEPNILSKSKLTPLYIAVRNNSIDIVKELLNHLADPNIQNEDGLTALHAAVDIESIDMVKVLLSHGADPNIQDIYGMTPLDLAKQEHFLDISSELLTHCTNYKATK